MSCPFRRRKALRRIWAETEALPAATPATETLFALRRAEARRGLQEDQAQAPGKGPGKAPGDG
jgi:hypothetical protein